MEMGEHTSLTFFLTPSLNTAWALWVLEGFCLLALKGFSREQQHASMPLLALMSLLRQVTWSLGVLLRVWAGGAVLGRRGWEKVRLRLGVQGEIGFCAFVPVCLLTLYATHLAGKEAQNPHRSIPLGIVITILSAFWRILVSWRPSPSWCPTTAGFPLCWVEPCPIYRGCWHPLCSYIQVSVTVFNPPTVGLSGIIALGLRDNGKDI